MSNLKTILVWYATPNIEAFTDLKKFCKKKGLKWNSYKAKEFPFNYKGFSLEKEVPGNITEYIERMGEKIKIQ